MCAARPLLSRTNMRKRPRVSEDPRSSRDRRRGSHWVLAYLQLGHVRLSGDKTKAKVAYGDFLTLWKDADPDIPILMQAKAESPGCSSGASAHPLRWTMAPSIPTRPQPGRHSGNSGYIVRRDRLLRDQGRQVAPPAKRALLGSSST